MKEDEPIADLFAAYTERASKAKTEAEKVRALIDIMTATVNRGDLSDRALALHLSYLGGAAAVKLRAYAAKLEQEAK